LLWWLQRAPMQKDLLHVVQLWTNWIHPRW
jgi:hypothetical protein